MHRCTYRRAAALPTLVLALATSQSLWASATGQPEARTDARPASQTRIYFGMWTSHVRHPGGGVDANSLVGVAFRGFYAGTFVNSYGDRAVAAGIQRSFTGPKDGALTTSLGYRLGFVSGYDERFLGIAGTMPVLPFAQLVGSVDHRKLGVELAYSGLTASVLVNWKL